MLSFSVYKAINKAKSDRDHPARRAACWESENDLKIIEEPPTTSLTDDD